MAKKPTKNELITFLQAAEIYGFTADYFQKLARRKRIKAKKMKKNGTGVEWRLLKPKAPSFRANPGYRIKSGTGFIDPGGRPGIQFA